jgi:hypothetical protein
MAGHLHVLTHTVTARFPCGYRVTVIVGYDPRDPLELWFHFVEVRRGTDWRFARDPLIEALWLGSAGDGALRFRTDETGVDHLWLLHSPDGHAELRFAMADLTDLATATHQLVSATSCPVDGDAEQRTLAEWGL